MIDSVGRFHGTANLAFPTEQGKVCNAVDFSAPEIVDYMTLANGSLNGRKTFSISLWAKTPDMTRRSIISGANNTEPNELLMWFDSGTVFAPDLSDTEIASFSTDNIADNIADNDWHHLVWTSSNSQNCLYRDAVLQGCENHTATTLNISSLILGQEQDSVGGTFDSTQAFDGLIDELVIFGSVLDVTQISEIYTNQNNGKGYDGSTRTCPVTPTPTAVLDMRFDENDWLLPIQFLTAQVIIFTAVHSTAHR